MCLLKTKKTEMCQHLQEKQKRMLAEEMFFDENEGRKDVTTVDIKEICAIRNYIQTFLEFYHPDKTTSSRAVYMFNDIVISHFCKVLKQKENQVLLDGFFTSVNFEKNLFSKVIFFKDILNN